MKVYNTHLKSEWNMYSIDATYALNPAETPAVSADFDRCHWLHLSTTGDWYL